MLSRRRDGEPLPPARPGGARRPRRRDGHPQRSYAKLYNRDHGRRGHLFRARYYSGPIEDDAHLLETIRYIALNPVRAGICQRPEDWRWGTYRATLGLDRAPPCIALSWLELFADTEASARLALHAFVLGGLAVEP
jgi:hypothetical protein